MKRASRPPAAGPDATAAGAAARPAIRAFAGDVYGGLDAATLKAADLDWAQQHLLILSGLYGALRPLDLIRPYRLEMGTALKTPRGKDLYAWWGEALAGFIDRQLHAPPPGRAPGRVRSAGDPVVVNLASAEYSRAALRPSLQARVVDIVFEEGDAERGWRVVGVLAKRARGLMARHAIVRRARRVAQLDDFDAEGYALAPAVSTPSRRVFRRGAV